MSSFSSIKTEKRKIVIFKNAFKGVMAVTLTHIILKSVHPCWNIQMGILYQNMKTLLLAINQNTKLQAVCNQHQSIGP